MNQREVLLVHFPRRKLPGERVERRVIAGDEHDSTGVPVQPVHNSGALGIAGDNLGIVRQNGIDQGAAGMSRRGMDDHARGLVDDQQRVILVQNVQRD